MVEVSFKVPKDAITSDTTYEIIVYAEGLPEYRAVLSVVVKAPNATVPEEDNENTEEPEDSEESEEPENSEVPENNSEDTP